MGVLHFLNVGQGDCSIIKHASGRITVIDICKARSPQPPPTGGLMALMLGAQPQRPAPLLTGGLGMMATPPPSVRPGFTLLAGPTTRPATSGLLGLAATLPSPTPENPICYMRDHGLTEVFRFILTHPDMDHMDGIKDLFSEFNPGNFWDTENTCTKSFPSGSPYREEDWLFYKGLRDGTRASTAKRLTLHTNDKGQFYNQAGGYGEPQDGLYVLAPTPTLVAEANRTGDFNDASYVILYKSAVGRILFCGDAHDKTWEHLLANHLNDIQGVELMIAPHHGRDSGRDRSFLSAVRPKLTLFGAAPSEHLAYDAWRNRGLDYITSNQGGNVVVDTNGTHMQVYVSKESFARKQIPFTTYSTQFRAWYLRNIA